MHTLLSLHTIAAPGLHSPLLQLSPEVQAFPSLQTNVLGTTKQPLVGLQVSSVQGLASLQSMAAPPLQVPPLHLSAEVHKLPSSQLRVLF